MSTVLDRVDLPADLRGLSVPELEQLAQDIRAMILETVSRTGGHLAANLGVVELTIALLKTFDPPKDRILWDVSHQTYAYKILTGRRERFQTLRQYSGISGFLRRDESEYDAFGAGHSGTAISAALGMAVARDRRAGDEHVVAVLGDGSLGCGVSLEGLTNLATATSRLVVVLNDNEMSIARNVGAVARYLGRLLASPRYNTWKGSVEQAAKRMRLAFLRRAYYRLEEFLKSLFLRSVLFEELGLRYIGPIDGHNLSALLDALAIARHSDKPIILHVSTQKGKGFAPAEAHPEEWHGKASFDPETGEDLVQAKSPTYSQAFGAVLERLAERDERIVAITAAMPAATGLTGFARKFPKRFFDVGICEEHAVVFAAGLAAAGMRPVFAVYSTFAQRVVDYVIHDVCLQNLPVIICLDRAGIVGDDGPTHHGVFDIALFRPVPNLVFAQPKDEAELAALLFSAVRWGRPTIVRYPRGVGTGVGIPDSPDPIAPGSAEVLRPGEDVRIWALGDMIPLAEASADLLRRQGLSAGVVNARFIRPLDGNLLGDQIAGSRIFITMENGIVTGGFGTAVEEHLGSIGYRGRILKIGWPDEFIPQGKPGELMEKFGLTPAAVAKLAVEALRK